jgi:hypothetical protein
LTAGEASREDLWVDPVTIIVAAVALGASAGLKDTAATAVKDAYAGLKRLIVDRYERVDLAPVESKPDSENKRGSLAEDLAEAGAGTDGELLEAARAVIAAVRAHEASAGAALGIDIQRVEAAALRIHRVDAEGTAVRMRDTKVVGEIDIGDVRAGRERPGRP